MTAALCFVAFAVIFIFLRPEPMLYVRLENEGIAVTPGRSMRAVFSEHTVQFAVFALGVSQLVMVMIMVITPLHMAHENYPTQAVSWVIMAHTLGMFGLSGVTGRMTTRYGPHPVIALGAIILAVSAVVAPMAQTMPMLAVALFLLGLGWNLGYVAGSALLADSVSSSERGQTQGISETLVAVAAAAGSFGTGPAFQRGGFIAVTMIGLALAVALLAIQGASQRYRPLPAASD